MRKVHLVTSAALVLCRPDRPSHDPGSARSCCSGMPPRRLTGFCRAGQGLAAPCPGSAPCPPAPPSLTPQISHSFSSTRPSACSQRHGPCPATSAGLTGEGRYLRPWDQARCPSGWAAVEREAQSSGGLSCCHRLPKEGPQGLGLANDSHGCLSKGGPSVCQVQLALLQVS